MARILVAGATGNLGQHIVTELKRRGHWVRALTRKPDRPFDLADEVAGGDLNRVDSLHAPCENIDILISAAGASVSPSIMREESDYETVDYWGNKNLLNVAESSGIKRFMYVSVYNTPDMQHLDYVRAHTRFARDLTQSGLAYTIVQPTGYFSAFEALLDIARWGAAPLIGNGSALTNPIHERDLAEVCVNALESEERHIAVGGPETLTRRQIFELAFHSLGKKPRFVNIPGVMISAQKRIVSLFDRRLAQLISFLHAVSQIDVVAPSFGTYYLGDYFAEKTKTVMNA